MTNILKFNASRFAFVASFVSTDEARYYLQGVYIEPHPERGVLMVAANGHLMGIAYDPDGHCAAPVIVGTKPTVQPFLRPKQRDADLTWIAVASHHDDDARQTRRVEHHGPHGLIATGLIEIVDGTYLDWRYIVPWDCFKSEKKFPMGVVNAKYLAEMTRPYGGDNFPVLITPGAELLDPILVRRPGLDWFFVVLMPMLRKEAPDCTWAISAGTKTEAAT